MESTHQGQGGKPGENTFRPCSLHSDTCEQASPPSRLDHHICCLHRGDRYLSLRPHLRQLSRQNQPLDLEETPRHGLWACLVTKWKPSKQAQHGFQIVGDYHPQIVFFGKTNGGCTIKL